MSALSSLDDGDGGFESAIRDGDGGLKSAADKPNLLKQVAGGASAANRLEPVLPVSGGIHPAAMTALRDGDGGLKSTIRDARGGLKSAADRPNLLKQVAGGVSGANRLEPVLSGSGGIHPAAMTARRRLENGWIHPYHPRRPRRIEIRR